MRDRRARLISIPVAIAALSASIVSSAPSATASAPIDCQDVYVIGARGSGQTEAGSDLGGWYADVVGRTVQQLKGQLRERDPSITVHDLPLNGDQYRALGGNGRFAGAAISYPGEYHHSANDGKSNARAMIEASGILGRQGSCLVFTGYSQGAQVTADLLQEYAQTHPQKVLGGMFYGDPYFSGQSRFNSSGLWMNPYNPTQHGGLGERAEYPDSLDGRVISTCHGRDPVCQGLSWEGGFPPKLALDFDAHGAYTRDASNAANRGMDMTEEAAISARTIVSRMGFPRPAPRFNGPVDVVFAFDTTGSMSSEIASARTYVRNLATTADARLAYARFGLVAYRDLGDEYSTKTITPLTADRDSLTTGIEKLSASGGGDNPEAVFAATSSAMKLGFRDKAEKLVVLIGDAEAHDPDRVTGETRQDVIDQAVASGVNISSIDYGGGVRTFAALAAATGGVVINGSTNQPMPLAAARSASKSEGDSNNPSSQDRSSNLAAIAAVPGNPLLDSITTTVELPNTRVATPDSVYRGKSTWISAAGSSDPVGYIKKYEWDLDGDGTFEERTTKPTINTIFTNTGDRTVSVRATNDMDLASSVTTTVNVKEVPAGYPSSAPESPPAPSVTPGDSSARIEITPNSSGSKPTVYTVTNDNGDVSAIVATDTQPAPSLRASNLVCFRKTYRLKRLTESCKRACLDHSPTTNEW